MTNAGRSPDEPAPEWAQKLAEGLAADRPAEPPPPPEPAEPARGDPNSPPQPATAQQPPGVVVIDYLGRPVPVIVTADTTNKPGAGKGSGAAAAAGALSKGGAAAGAAGVGGAIAGALATKFALILGPLVAIQNVLSQASSGFATFQKAVTVFSSTLAPLLLPVFVVLAAAVVAVSDLLFNRLRPVLEDFYDWVIKAAKAVNEFIHKMLDATERVLRFIDQKFGTNLAPPERPKEVGPKLGGFDPEQVEATKRRPMPKELETPERLFTAKEGTPEWDEFQRLVAAQDEWHRQEDDRVAGRVKAVNEAPDRKAARERLGLPPEPGWNSQLTGTFAGALKDVTLSLQRSIGPKASYSALSAFGQQGQLAALNNDPLDAKSIQRSIAAIEALLRAIEKNTDKQPQPNFRPGGR